MNPLSLATVGDNTVDIYSGAEQRVLVGGNALNTAVQWSLMGHRSAYYGAIGRDPFGQKVRSSLESNGVTSELIELRGNTSTTDIRVEDDGERIIVQDNFEVSGEYMPDSSALDALAKRDFVHIGMSPFASAIRKELKARGARISQDCAVSSGFDNLDVAFCSADADDIEVEEMARAAIDQGAKVVVVTRGAAGSTAFDGKVWQTIAADEIPAVVDTTGAGDSYIAGFVAARASGETLLECMRQGARVAARTCQHWGGFPQPEN